MDKPDFVFDLDGTLLDTLADLGGACNRMLAAHGWPTHSIPSYKSRIGNGFGKLVDRSIPKEVADSIDAETLARLYHEGKEQYSRGLADKTTPYPGMESTLAKLKGAGCRLAVLTNKFADAAQSVIGHFFPGTFDLVRGGVDGFPLKPNPAGLALIMETLSLNKENVLYVGDSSVDVELAHAAGVKVVGVSWGFRGREHLESHGADFVIDRPEELIRFLSMDGK